MRSRSLLLILAVELGALSALAVWLVHGRGWSWLEAVGLALAVFLGLRAALISTLYLLAWRWGSPARPLCIGDLVGNGAREYLAYLAMFSLIQPFERLWLGPDRLHQVAPDKLPVLLVHGYRCNRGTWWWLRRRLEAAGQCVATVNLEPEFADIDHYADHLAHRIEEVCAATGSEQLALVGHSMGGLAIRAYLRRYGPGRVAKVMSLGTPYHGSLLAWFARGPNGRQMRPGDPWLMKLNADLAVCPVPLTAVFSDRDNYVLPQSRQALAGASNRMLHGVGHLALVFSEQTAGLMLEWLAGE